MSTDNQKPLHLLQNKPPKRPRGIYLLPNLFTIGALFFGFYAIVMSTRAQFDAAAIAIFIAMILDGLDGRIARMINAQSEFGAQLDSLADMVSFGLAPALLMYSWSLHQFGKAGWLVAFIYTACTALRLARFNMRHAHRTDKSYFQGLSTTAAAGCIASLVWLCQYYGLNSPAIATLTLILTLLLAFLKVSTIAFRSFKEINFRNRVPFTVILLVVVIFVLISFAPYDTLALAFWAYALSGPTSFIFRFFKRRYRRHNTQKKTPY